MVETFVEYLLHLPPSGVLLFAFFIAFSENIFPPSPSDMLIVFCGALVGAGTVDFAPLALSSTLGGVCGFSVMYVVGRRFGDSIIHSPRWRFFQTSSIEKVEQWFRKYGDWLIVANRFLSGTRAVISLFAGISNLPFGRTLAFSAISALAWNCLLIVCGIWLGDNWRQINEYFIAYAQIITPTIIIVIAGLAIHWSIKRKKNNNPPA